MSFQSFKIGFWHPFGPHGPETPHEILRRKSAEVEDVGWTLWSFRYRKALSRWAKMIGPDRDPVFALCSDGGGAKNPAGKIAYATHYRMLDEKEWRVIPERISVPHPAGDNKIFSAFIVDNVITDLKKLKLPKTVSWLRISDWEWMDTGLPTRPEYLIKADGRAALRPLRTALRLRHPYVAYLGINP